MEESVRGEDLELEHLEGVMCKMWRHSGGKPGIILTGKTEIVLNALLCVPEKRGQGYSLP